MNFGIRANLVQVLQQLLQVLFVGMTLGMMRTVVPALAESEFGVPRGSFMLLVAFVVAFGFVKGTMNFVAGRLAERVGHRGKRATHRMADGGADSIDHLLRPLVQLDCFGDQFYWG